MANKLTEPYWLAWLKWHVYRQFRANPRYRTMWRFRQWVRDCQPGGLFIDCGANVGDVTALFLQKGFVVHAFEPDGRARSELARRHGENPLLTIHDQAVGSSYRKQFLYRAGSGDLETTQASSFFNRPEALHDTTFDVEVIDLFAFIAALGKPVDVLKLDIEGAEVEILERMLDENALVDVARIYVETHESISEDIARRTAAVRARVVELGRHNIDLDWH